jgi:hypothetical protein
LDFVNFNEVRDLHFAAGCRSLTSFGMTIPVKELSFASAGRGAAFD